MWARKYKTFRVLFALLITGFSVTAAGSDHVRLANTSDEPTHVLARQILELAYARAGIEVEFIDMPFLRSLTQSNGGYLDGEVARLTVIEKDYPNLVRIPVKLFDISTFAYATSPIPKIRTWQDLKGKRLGLELGVVLTERATKGFPRTFSSSQKELVMMLRRGGVDLVVYSGMKAFGEPEFKFHRSAPLQTESMYHYLHQRKARFIRPLMKELQALKDEGVMNLLYKEATR